MSNSIKVFEYDGYTLLSDGTVLCSELASGVDRLTVREMISNLADKEEVELEDISAVCKMAKRLQYGRDLCKDLSVDSLYPLFDRYYADSPELLPKVFRKYVKMYCKMRRVPREEAVKIIYARLAFLDEQENRERGCDDDVGLVLADSFYEIYEEDRPQLRRRFPQTCPRDE